MEIIEIKSTVIQIKNFLDGINSRMERTEERIRELENGLTEFTQYEQQRLNRLEKI